MLGQLNDGRLLGVEVKAEKGKLRPEQTLFLEGRTPKGSQNAMTHGIYSRVLSEAEKHIADNLKFGNVDDELSLTKIRLMRALKREAEQLGQYELDSKVEREGNGPNVARLEKTYKVKDYFSPVDKLTARIQSLERDRAMLVDAQLSAEIKRAEVNNLNGNQMMYLSAKLPLR